MQQNMKEMRRDYITRAMMTNNPQVVVLALANITKEDIFESFEMAIDVYTKHQYLEGSFSGLCGDALQRMLSMSDSRFADFLIHSFIDLSYIWPIQERCLDAIKSLSPFISDKLWYTLCGDCGGQIEQALEDGIDFK